MRFIETKKLNDYIISTGDVLQCAPGELTTRLGSLKSVSLQGFSIDHDRAFLRELSSVLNVIVSIINHPHIANRREEVIIRIEQAQQISQEAFLNTIKDSKLWKAHDLRMIPEEVYYHQHIDELRIYENRFIGFLIDLIDKELAKFSNFYLSKLPTLTSLQGTLSSHEIGKQIVQIDRLRRKTQFIKNTYFYREVSKGKPISRKIQPTNILLKDRLYRYCFRFYKDFMRYEDSKSAMRDLRSYYMILLFRELCSQGFIPVVTSKDKYIFANRDYTLALQPMGNDALLLTVRNAKFPQQPAHHVLGFHVETEKTIGDVKVACTALDADVFDEATMALVQEALNAAASGIPSRWSNAAVEDEDEGSFGSFGDARLTFINAMVETERYNEMLLQELRGEVQLIFRYRRSYLARLSQADDAAKDHYNAIKNLLLSYKGVKGRTSRSFETFHAGRTPLVKLNAKAHALHLYLALDPADLADSKYHFKDVSAKKKYAAVPVLIKVKGERQLKHALELLTMLCDAKMNLAHNANITEQDYRIPYKTTEELIREDQIRLMVAAVPVQKEEPVAMPDEIEAIPAMAPITSTDTDGDAIDGRETISLWEICYADSGIPASPHTDTEENLIRTWLSQKISHLQTDPYVYKKYCPICRSRGIDNTNDVYTCPACSSSYMFAQEGEDTTVWFRKIRKKGLS